MVPVNIWAVIFAAVATMIMGFLWYGPFFGKQWLALMNFSAQHMEDAKKKGMMKSNIIMFAGALVMAYILEHVLVFASAYMNFSGLDAGVTVACMVWLGFIVPVTLGPVLWENKPWKLWFINAGYYLAVLVIMGVILATWM